MRFRGTAPCDDLAFGIRGAGHGSYGAGSVTSDSSRTVSEGNVFIGGDDGASILSGSRSGEGRNGRTLRENRVVGNVLLFNRLFVMTIRDWQHVKPSTAEFGPVFSGNAIVQPASGATPFHWDSRRYNTLADLEKNEPRTAFGNTWYDDWRRLPEPLRVQFHRAFGRIVRAILPEELAAFDAADAQLLDVLKLSSDGKSRAYIVDAGEPILLIDLELADTLRFQSPESELKNKVRVLTGNEQIWRDAEVSGAAVTMRLPQGVHLVRGLPVNVQLQK